MNLYFNIGIDKEHTHNYEYNGVKVIEFGYCFCRVISVESQPQAGYMAHKK